MAPAVALAPALALAGALDLIAWAAFRIDKARARRQRRRIRERTLLGLAALGGVGAVVAMYGHRQRHKVAKPRFVVIATLAALAQAGALAWWWRAGR
ncbi:MAG: DUF1294 domain-containing protein [Myxococcales bacterium]|nr:DUF1294 domain-containing protein [Myxococcales bacterium]